MAVSQSLTPQEKRAQVGMHLKNADKHIREKKLDEAKLELAKVRELEPNNAYAMAFEERISALVIEANAPPPPPEPAPVAAVKSEAPAAAPEKEKDTKSAAPAGDKAAKPAADKSVPEKPIADKPAGEKAASAKAPEKSGEKPGEKPVEKTGEKVAEPAAKAEQPAPKPTAPKPAPSETAVRSDIETKVEDDYKVRFATEIQKAEQRVSEKLKVEEEKHAAERASLLDQLQKERAKFREQVEQDFAVRLKDELKKREDTVREELEREKKRVEEEVHARVQSEYEARARETDKKIEAERRALAAKEEQSISAMKQELEADFASRLLTELEKLKESSQVKEEKGRLEVESALRTQLQKEYESRIGDERGQIEGRYHKLQEQLEASYKDQQDKALAENKRLIDEQLSQAHRTEEQKFEQERIALRKSLEEDHAQKIQAMLADERRKQEEETQLALRLAREEFERERSRLMNQEQQTLEGLRQTLREEMASDMQTQVDKVSKDIERSYEHKMILLGVEIPKTKEQKLKLYETRVREAWALGPMTMEKAQVLMEIQEILGLEFDEHSTCESEVRLQLYAENVQSAILGGKLKPNDTGALDEMKARYDISPDEAANVEPIILSAFQRIAVKAILMIVDDDTALLEIIAEHLRSLGYNVLAYDTLASAMTAIETQSVDLILSDIQFKGEKGDGFTFFKNVQQKPHLRKIPFILMSSLDEGLFIRTGVQLGVDDYLTKPLDLDLLAAVIEGKLKKYKMMNS